MRAAFVRGVYRGLYLSFLILGCPVAKIVGTMIGQLIHSGHTGFYLHD